MGGMLRRLSFGLLGTEDVAVVVDAEAPAAGKSDTELLKRFADARDAYVEVKELNELRMELERHCAAAPCEHQKEVALRKAYAEVLGQCVKRGLKPELARETKKVEGDNGWLQVCAARKAGAVDPADALNPRRGTDNDAHKGRAVRRNHGLY